MSNAFGKGLHYILVKEWTRWKEYFIVANVIVLCGLLTGLMLSFIRPTATQKKSTHRGLSLLLSISATAVLFAVADPHVAAAHVIPVIPFFFLLFAHQIKVQPALRKRIMSVLAVFIILNCGSSIALAGKIYYKANKAGYNIKMIDERVNSILPYKNWQYIIIGPTEIWPFINGNRDVLIIDTARTGKAFEKLSPVIHSVDYVILNEDYADYRWEEKFHQFFPNVMLEKVCSIGDDSKFLRIYRIHRRQAVLESCENNKSYDDKI